MNSFNKYYKSIINENEDIDLKSMFPPASKEELEDRFKSKYIDYFEKYITLYNKRFSDTILTSINDIFRKDIINNSKFNPLTFIVGEQIHKPSFKPTTEAIRILLEKGADPNIKSNASYGYTYPIIGVRCLESLKLFIKYNANINAKDIFQYTVLHNIVSSMIDVVDMHPMIEFLVNNGADINAKDEDGKIPLHLFVEHIGERYNFNVHNIVKLLFNDNTDFDFEATDGKSINSILNYRFNLNKEKLLSYDR